MKNRHNKQNISAFLSEIEYSINIEKCWIELLKEHFDNTDSKDFISILLVDEIERNNIVSAFMVEKIYENI